MRLKIKFINLLFKKGIIIKVKKKKIDSSTVHTTNLEKLKTLLTINAYLLTFYLKHTHIKKLNFSFATIPKQANLKAVKKLNILPTHIFFIKKILLL